MFCEVGCEGLACVTVCALCQILSCCCFYFDVVVKDFCGRFVFCVLWRLLMLLVCLVGLV